MTRDDVKRDMAGRAVTLAIHLALEADVEPETVRVLIAAKRAITRQCAGHQEPAAPRSVTA